MKFSVPSNIIFLLFCFLLLDILDEILLVLYSTIAEVVNDMNNHTLSTHYGITPNEANMSFLTSMVSVLMTFGTVLSLFFVIPLAESKGRKFATVHCRIFLLIIAALFLIFSSFFTSSELFLLAEIFIGIEHPLRTYTTIMFVTECAPDKNRGFASTALIFAQVVGRMLLYSLGSPGIFGTTGLWFIFPVFVAVCSALMLIITSKLPDSPKWLVCQNRVEEAKRAINYYHGPETDTGTDKSSNLFYFVFKFSDQALSSLIKEKNLTTETKLSFKQVIGDETMREALNVIFAITFFFLLDGTSSQSVYTVVLHKNAGFSVQETMNISLILVIVFFPTKFIGTYIIDALGRRPVMLLGGIICFSKSVLMIATQLVIHFAGESLLTKMMYVAVESLTAAIPATGVNTLHVLFISELFPPSARTSVAQVLLITAIVIDSPLLSLFPFVYSIFPPGFFAPFAISQFFFGIYLYRHMPETSGRAVYDIIDSMEQVVFSWVNRNSEIIVNSVFQSQTLADEKVPLLRDRASTLLATKRNSILNTSRARVQANSDNSKFISVFSLLRTIKN
ncbi:Protein CBG14184 [Caenorhabditis briggsae]|uniref:Protein CBG14184 n=1 Tax=Caenorhabditis briggsae TaxID=6238 RepID=A8XJG6_CAEBR|nr:Protein CBG14184 [Caenorhabditis briggsae]CAP32791.2 Protein CBG14184 [Caenorhabditis briggsae]